MRAPDGYMTLAQTREYLEVSRSTLYRLIKNEGLPIHRKRGSEQGGYVKKDELEEWLVRRLDG